MDSSKYKNWTSLFKKKKWKGLMFSSCTKLINDFWNLIFYIKPQFVWYNWLAPGWQWIDISHWINPSRYTTNLQKTTLTLSNIQQTCSRRLRKHVGKSLENLNVIFCRLVVCGKGLKTSRKNMENLYDWKEQLLIIIKV